MIIPPTHASSKRTRSASSWLVTVGTGIGWWTQKQVLSGKISSPKRKLRGFWRDSLRKPAFKVTSAEVVIICPDWCEVCMCTYFFLYRDIQKREYDMIYIYTLCKRAFPHVQPQTYITRQQMSTTNSPFDFVWPILWSTLQSLYIENHSSYLRITWAFNEAPNRNLYSRTDGAYPIQRTPTCKQDHATHCILGVLPW